MSKLTTKLIIVVSTVIIVSVAYLIYQSSINSQTETPPTVSYYLLTADPGTKGAITFPGCGDDYLVRHDSTTPGGLQEALNELFSIEDGFKSAFTNSENLQAAVTENVINIQGELISAGTCDDPRIINQITKTVEIYFPEGDYQILLNESADDWRCWNDMSGLCE